MSHQIQRLARMTGLLVGLALLGPAGALAAGPLTWSAPAQIDVQPSIDANAIYSISCPSATLCVAGDDAGNILSSTNPGGGRAAWSSAAVDVHTGGQFSIEGMSCPSTTLCVAVDEGGGVLTSNNPAGGAAAWIRAAVDSSPAGLSSIACPSVSFCVAVDGDGKAFTSAAPAGGAATWFSQDIDGTNSLSSVSCPTTSFCAAVDDKGNVLTDTAPSTTWAVTHLTSRALLSVSCASASLCIAADNDGVVWSSSAPTTGASAWHSAAISSGVGMKALECEAPSFCLAPGDAIHYSANPTGGSAAWTQVGSSFSFEPTALSCVGTSFCAAGDDGGDIAVSTSPTTGAGWAPAQVDGAPTLFGVSCPRVTQCFADDDSGHILVSSHPTGGVSAWRATDVGSHHASASFYGLACPAVSLCVAPIDYGPYGTSGSGGSGTYSKTPAGSPTSWKVFGLLHGVDPIVHGFFNAGCAGTSLCAITQDDGTLFVSTSPTKPKTWKKKSSKGQHAGVFCPRRGRCVAPGGSCPTRSFCAVLKTVGDGVGDGRVSTSTAPARGAKHWKTVTIDRGHVLTSISCATAKLCFAVDSIGNVFYSTRPAAASSWHVADRVAGPLYAISCPSRGLCIAVGANGVVVTGSHG
jgi:hypothetical protein